MRTIAMCCLVLIAAGCGGEPPPSERAASTPEPAGKPMLVDGYQVVRVIVKDDGYHPERFELQAGTPAKVVFVQESDTHCASQIQIPEFGVPVTDLPVGKETIVEFAPQKAGEFAFMCGMDMMRGTILVTS